MQIVPVETEKELTEFIDFPWQIYQNDTNWVPMLKSELRTILNENKNPFWKHSKKKLFLLKHNKTILGRIAGIIDYNYVQFHNIPTGFFGYFECVNDSDCAEMLFSAVKSWLKENNMTTMLGPTNPSTNDEMGFLLEGYDSPPYLMMPYNPSYYHTLCIKNRLNKAKDLYAYYQHKETLPIERLKTLVEKVKKRVPGLLVRKLNMKDFNNEIKLALKIYNSAWEKNWGFVPWTEEEFYSQCERLKPLILPDTTLIAFVDSAPVGIIVGVPNYNEVLKRLNGKLGPIGLIKFLYYKNKINSLRILIMGMIKEYRNRGIEGVMYWDMIQNAIKLGFVEGEFSWILEDNVLTCRACEMLGSKLYKKYRIYETSI